MKKRAATLVELLVALTVAAIIATIAGVLLFDGLESWRKEADRETAIRRATLTADKIANDLAAQPDWSDLAAPVTTFELAKQGATAAFFTTGPDTREIAVCWYLTGTQPYALMRYIADADSTEASRPGNAAQHKVADAFADTTGVSLDELESASFKWCEGVESVRLIEPSGGIPQIILKTLTPEGRKRFEGGETIGDLPERCRVDVARPVAGN